MNDKEKIDKFIHSNLNDDFGLSVDDLVGKVKGIGRFSAWCGNNSSQIKQVLNAVKSIGVSPALFATYEKMKVITQVGVGSTIPHHRVTI
ncbi:hypothetical protein CoNPh32_CDS0017 [Staphylococcus phage S-CoN_Ph32]|nr:hypothetical protein CoNPh32_CDS0017 [Staphylococcus phage S-CoN_Ph32]